MNNYNYISGELLEDNQTIKAITNDGQTLFIPADGRPEHQYLITNNLLVDNKLQKLKDKKIRELESYYNSSANWTFTVYSETLKASLTQEVDWFGSKLPLLSSNTVILTMDDGKDVYFQFRSNEQKNNLGELIVIKNGMILKATRKGIADKIANAFSEEVLNMIDVISTLHNCVTRKINIDKI
jgi:hypothetical protein